MMFRMLIIATALLGSVAFALGAYQPDAVLGVANHVMPVLITPLTLAVFFGLFAHDQRVT